MSVVTRLIIIHFCTCLISLTILGQSSNPPLSCTTSLQELEEFIKKNQDPEKIAEAYVNTYGLCNIDMDLYDLYKSKMKSLLEKNNVEYDIYPNGTYSPTEPIESFISNIKDTELGIYAIYNLPQNENIPPLFKDVLKFYDILNAKGYKLEKFIVPEYKILGVYSENKGSQLLDFDLNPVLPDTYSTLSYEGYGIVVFGKTFNTLQLYQLKTKKLLNKTFKNIAPIIRTQDGHIYIITQDELKYTVYDEQLNPVFVNKDYIHFRPNLQMFYVRHNNEYLLYNTQFKLLHGPFHVLEEISINDRIYFNTRDKKNNRTIYDQNFKKLYAQPEYESIRTGHSTYVVLKKNGKYGVARQSVKKIFHFFLSNIV